VVLVAANQTSDELRVEDLHVIYRDSNREVRAVDGVTFGLRRGNIVGLVGESACGKTTLGLSMLSLLPRNASVVKGRIMLGNRDITAMTEDELNRIRWRQISMIFQSAMNALNPVGKVGEQLVDVLKFHEHLSDSDAKSRVESAMDQVGISREMLGHYPHEFSGGMRQRAVIAMSLLCDPKFVIADEPTTGLDVVVQQQILNEIRKLKRDRSTGILLISHDISVVAQTCDVIAVMYAGKIFELGDVQTIFRESRNPYTMALLKAFPRLRSKTLKLESIQGYPPDLSVAVRGCRFAPRCPYAQDTCLTQEPSMIEVASNHNSRCHFAQQLR
jgi:peptide/nickel transport system ATP-binding protein